MNLWSLLKQSTDEFYHLICIEQCKRYHESIPRSKNQNQNLSIVLVFKNKLRKHDVSETGRSGD
jgi:hypothetical protein